MSGPDPIDVLLGDMDPGERAHAAADPELAARLERLAPAVEALRALPDDAWDPPVPPPLRHPGRGARPEVAAPAARARARRGRSWWRGSMPVPVAGLAAAGALAVGLVVGGGVWGGSGGDPADRPVADVPLAAFGDGPPRAGGDARILAGQQVALQVHGLAPSARGFYTAWLLDSDGKMIALGSFRVPASGTVTVRLPLPVAPRRFDFVDVSAEPDDGDPGHSGHSVLRGPTA